MNIKDHLLRTPKTKNILTAAILFAALVLFLFANAPKQSTRMSSVVTSTDEICYSAVTITSGATCGNGVIFSADDNEIIIATALHVISEEADITVTFCDKKKSPASLIRQDPSLDIAFLKVDKKDNSITDDLYKTVIVTDSDDKASYLSPGTIIYVYNSITGQTHAGSIALSSVYSEDFNMDLICCYLDADPGMSGCGLFDVDSHFLGILLGGTDDGKSVYLSADQCFLR